MAKTLPKSEGISFVLKESESEKPTPIIILFFHNGRRTKIYTGEKIHYKQWNFGEQRAKTRGYVNNGYLNDTLDAMADRLEAFYKLTKAQGYIPTDEQLRESIVLKEASELPIAPTVFQSGEELIENAQTRGKKNTAKEFRTTLNHLESFAKACRYPISYETLTEAFLDKFVNYLLTKLKQTDNTIAKQVNTLKRILYHATEREDNTNLKFRKFNWKRKDPDVHALTAEDVEALENIELLHKPYLDNARNLFLIGVYTGLRFSDYSAIQPEHVRPDHLRITTIKTNDTLSIPLTIKAKRLIERYLTGEVHPITNQRLNKYIKEVAKLAGLDQPIIIQKYRAGKRYDTTKPKYEVIATHWGRKSFVTLQLERGMRPEVVQRISGHRNQRSFNRYVSVTDQTVMKEFAKVNEVEPALKVV